MAFLLDTNVISEIVRPKPAQHVLEWIETQTPSDLFLASQTIGELVRGARKVKDRARRERFESWIMKDLTLQFEDRILPFDNDAARIWGTSPRMPVNTTFSKICNSRQRDLSATSYSGLFTAAAPTIAICALGCFSRIAGIA
ncbi:MAG: PIN domain-containing protein [Proteobacteria bacterium]|nr:PIN domain-containing protein [Pseudomonadota bacterium]